MLKRISVRSAAEVDFQQRLKKELGDQFSISEYRKEAQKTDRALSEKCRQKNSVRVVNRKRHR